MQFIDDPRHQIFELIYQLLQIVPSEHTSSDEDASNDSDNDYIRDTHMRNEYGRHCSFEGFINCTN